MSLAHIPVNAVLANAPGFEVLPGPMRVLAVLELLDCTWLIEIPRPNAEGRTPPYVKGPTKWTLSQLSGAKENLQIVISTYRLRAPLTLPDAEILQRVKSRRERRQLQKTLEDRDKRWSALLPVLARSPGCETPRTFLEVISDPSHPTQIKDRAAELRVAVSWLYNIIHRYWALGSTKNALATEYWRVGCPGKKKKQAHALGRRSRPYNAGDSGPPYILSDEDKSLLAQGYRLISKTRKPRAAFYLVSCCFWADSETDPDGKTRYTLWATDKRPSFDQFLRWGRDGNEQESVSEMILGRREWRRLTESRGGSVQDQVTMVCQAGCFDGTSTDVYLKSVFSRLDTLPPMLREVLIEQRSTVAYGFYTGWQPASPKTALLAILNGAESKVPLFARFGIEITDDDMPSFLCKTHFADNGELKAASITEVEEQFGFSVEYAEAGMGERKGTSESNHRGTHKRLDHCLPGTTFGRLRKRGEKPPATTALYNYPEYMHEFLRALLDYNNEEVLELAPAAMLKESPEIPPTRLNIFKWLRTRGMTAEIPCDPAMLRAFVLPTQEAVIRKNGIYLLGDILGYRSVVPKMRYTGSALVDTGLLAQVKRTGKSIRVQVRMADNDLSKVWLPTRDRGPIEVHLAGRDTVLQRQLSLTDWLHCVEGYILAKARRSGQVDQVRANTVLRREATRINARREKNSEATAQLKKGKQATQAQQLRNLDANRKREMATFEPAVWGIPPNQPQPARESTAAAAPPDVAADLASRAAANAMAAFNDLENHNVN